MRTGTMEFIIATESDRMVLKAIRNKLCSYLTTKITKNTNDTFELRLCLEIDIKPMRGDNKRQD